MFLVVNHRKQIQSNLNSEKLVDPQNFVIPETGLNCYQDLAFYDTIQRKREYLSCHLSPGIHSNWISLSHVSNI